MIKTFAGAAVCAGVGQTHIFTVGIPDGEVWKLLEIRVPTPVVQASIVAGSLNGMIQYEIVPTLNNHDFVIGDDLPGPMEIRWFMATPSGQAQNVGVTLVFDIPKAY